MSSVTTRDEAVRGAKALADYADRMYSEASTVPVGQDMADEVFELMGWAKEHGSKPGLIVMPSRSAEQTWLKVKHSAYAVLGALGEREECPACSATGWTSSASCGQCDGVGWLFVRGQRR